MRITHYAHTTAVAEWLNMGRHEMYRDVNLSPTKLKELGLELGQFFEVDNTVYRAVRARSAATGLGYIGKTYMNAAGRTGTAAVSTKDELITADTFVKGDLDGGRVWFDSGTDGGRRRILKNGDSAGASTVRVAPKTIHHLRKAGTTAADAFTAAPDGTSTYKIHCDWEVEMTSAATDLVTCVFLGAVTSGNLTIVAVEGPYVDIFIDGNEAGKGATAGGLICPSATAGVAVPATAAGILAAEAATYFAQSYDVYTGAGAARTCRLFSRFALGGARQQYVN